MVSADSVAGGREARPFSRQQQQATNTAGAKPKIKLAGPTVTASMLIDGHWTGSIPSPHPVKDLADKHRSKLVKLEEMASAVPVIPARSSGGRVQNLIAQIETLSPSRQNGSVPSSPSMCDTPSTKQNRRYGSHSAQMLRCSEVNVRTAGQ
eukprot:scaffold148224_cov36-Prasinocladus_malaysianus.AAC.2